MTGFPFNIKLTCKERDEHEKVPFKIRTCARKSSKTAELAKHLLFREIASFPSNWTNRGQIWCMAIVSIFNVCACVCFYRTFLNYLPKQCHPESHLIMWKLTFLWRVNKANYSTGPTYSASTLWGIKSDTDRCCRHCWSRCLLFCNLSSNRSHLKHHSFQGSRCDLSILSFFKVKINMEEIQSKASQFIESLGYKKVTGDHAIY